MELRFAPIEMPGLTSGTTASNRHQQLPDKSSRGGGYLGYLHRFHKNQLTSRNVAQLELRHG
jgi:hypothetical protein